MNITSTHVRKMVRSMLVAAVCCCALSSCDSFIYDNEGDCGVTYRIKFRYDRNMKWADAFSHEVKSVHLYAFDRNGILVWQNSDEGAALAADDYSMTLDLPAGDYHLLAWCGLENGGPASESFSVPEAYVGETRLEDMTCRLNREYDASGAYSREKLHPLYHGTADVSLPDLTYEGGEYTATMSLTKDTNHVRVILQHLSGEPVSPDDFDFRIEEANGLMAHNNLLLPDEMITYKAHHTQSGTTGLGLDDYPENGRPRRIADTPARGITSVSVAIADLTIARLTDGRATYLTVLNSKGDIATRIPLRDYALLLKDNYAYEMTDEEYLDRQDEWALTFFLDESDKWIETSIIINSWRVVPNPNVDFGKE